MHPDSARELKYLLLERLRAAGPATAETVGAGAGEHRGTWIAVGLAPAGPGRARVAVRLERAADLAALPDLGRASRTEWDVRVIGRVRALSSPTSRWAPAALQQRVRPLRPGLSVAHPAVTAGTLGGFVRTSSGVAVLSNNHVLAASDAASPGDAVLQPGPADRGTATDRVATLTAFVRFRSDAANLVDAAVAALDPGTRAEPGDLPGGPLGATAVPAGEIDPDVAVEKVGRTTGHTQGRITAVEVDGVAVQYDSAVHVFDDQVEIEGVTGAFSAGGDSGSVIWRGADRAPLALLFAGSETGGTGGSGVTFANPLATVLEQLGAQWLPG